MRSSSKGITTADEPASPPLFESWMAWMHREGESTWTAFLTRGVAGRACSGESPCTHFARGVVGRGEEGPPRAAGPSALLAHRNAGVAGGGTTLSSCLSPTRNQILLLDFRRAAWARARALRTLAAGVGAAGAGPRGGLGVARAAVFGVGVCSAEAVRGEGEPSVATSKRRRNCRIRASWRAARDGVGATRAGVLIGDVRGACAIALRVVPPAGAAKRWQQRCWCWCW